MRKIFKDEQLDLQFKENGYIVLKDAVNFNFQESYSYFNNLQSNVDGKFYASLWSKDREYREEVDREIKKRLSSIVTDYLYNYVSFFGDLLVKKPSLNHKFDWHQDWTFVDETKYSSVYIWCPLQDVTIQNGCLMVLPNSHSFFKSTRGSNINPDYPHETFEAVKKKHIRYLPLKKGDVVLFNQSLFHASPPNRTWKNRLAIGLLCLPEEADIFHYHLNKESNIIEQYKIDYGFIMNFSNDQNFLKNLYTQNLQKPQGGILVSNSTPKPEKDNSMEKYIDYLNHTSA